jgi:hypothetical protein
LFAGSEFGAGACTQRGGALIAGATSLSGVLDKGVAENGSRVAGIEIGAVGKVDV